MILHVFYLQRSLHQQQQIYFFCCKLCLVVSLFTKRLSIQNSNIFLFLFSIVTTDCLDGGWDFFLFSFKMLPWMESILLPMLDSLPLDWWTAAAHLLNWCICSMVMYRNWNCLRCDVWCWGNIVWQLVGKKTTKIKTYRGVRAYNVRVGVTLPEGFFTRRSRGCGRWSGIFTSVSDPVYQCCVFAIWVLSYTPLFVVCLLIIAQIYITLITLA